jgi:IS30 family transposase
MTYHQLTDEERYTIAALRKEGLNQAQIAQRLQRHRSTISREVRRNAARLDGAYRAQKAIERTNGRRSRSRRNTRFKRADWKRVERLLRCEWSPEQTAGVLARSGELSISHETIYRYVWADRARGGNLARHLRCSGKQRRKRYGRYDSRGRLAGKRHISTRAKSIERRKQVGHWEIDTVMGGGNTHCIMTLVERATGYLVIRKLRSRNARELARSASRLIEQHPGKFKTITADNGTEFHSYKRIEAKTDVKFYFATPYHSWERGTNENTNGLIRQYLPKRTSMAKITQRDCDRIALKLNTRPRKRYGFRTPKEIFDAA